MAFDGEAALSGLGGGLLIGLAAAAFLLVNGRIAGMTGLIARATGLAGGRPEGESAAFLGGAFAGALGLAALAGPQEIAVTTSMPLLVASGLLVGLGTRVSNGCTSGHGVCGLSRLSRRSFVAVAVFMGAAAVTVAVTRHLVGGGA